MLLLMFALWVAFNGRVTVEIVLFGIAVSALVFLFLFLCRHMDYSIKKERNVYQNIFGGIAYIALLLCEIIKANFCVIKLIVSPKYIIEPKLLQFQTKLEGDTKRVVLANSITLTPGTITVSLEGDKYLIHCLDKELGEGISDCTFVKRLERFESGKEEKKDGKTI